jgi:Domain of unknown function (DUF4865)
MIAKQYSITLPSDYDMGIIRRRVDERGSAYDTFPGLHFKAFLIRERGRFGSIANEYAPFYVWPNTEALWGFVAGEGFRGIIDSFGRMPITTWFTFDVTARADLKPIDVRAATREEVALGAGCDLALLRQEETLANAEALSGNPLIAARVVAVNTERWILVRFTMFSCEQDDLRTSTAVESFEVLRLCAPGLLG